MAKAKKRMFNLRKREDVMVRTKDGFQLLVNEVKKHPLLYDPFHESYKDAKRKKNAWANIAKELLQYTRNYSLTKIRTSWAKGVEILQRKLKEKSKKPWKYMEDMQFFVPFLQAEVKRKEKLNENKIASLIQEVKKYPYLYNPSNFRFNASKTKRIAWIKIGETLHCTSEKAKYLWQKTLQRYREGINQKGEENVESNKPPIEEWVHYKSMEFMKSFVTKTSELICKDREDARINKIVELIKAVEEHPVLYNPHSSKSKAKGFVKEKRKAWNIIGEKLQHPSMELRTVWQSLKAKLKSNPSPSFKFYKHMEFLIPFLGINKAREGSALDSDEDALSMAISEENPRMHKKKMTYEEELLQSDPIYNFFMSAYNATEKMPKALQLRMKKEIFEAVTDAEEMLWEASLIQPQMQS